MALPATLPSDHRGPSTTATGAANPQSNGLDGQQAFEKDYEIAKGISMV